METDFQRLTTLLGGAQLATGFFYGSSRDPLPGRFIGRALAGVVIDSYVVPGGRYPDWKFVFTPPKEP